MKSCGFWRLGHLPAIHPHDMGYSVPGRILRKSPIGHRWNIEWVFRFRVSRCINPSYSTVIALFPKAGATINTSISTPLSFFTQYWIFSWRFWALKSCTWARAGVAAKPKRPFFFTHAILITPRAYANVWRFLQPVHVHIEVVAVRSTMCTAVQPISDYANMQR